MKLYSLLQKILDRFCRKLPGTKKAFTLIELVIALAIFGVFSAGVVGVLVPAVNVYTNAIQGSDARLIASNIMGTIENELIYAQQDDAFPLAVKDEGEVLQFKGGSPARAVSFTSINPETKEQDYLYYSISPYGGTGTDVTGYELYYDVPYYKNFQVRLSFSMDNHNVVEALVDVLDRNGDVAYTLTSRLRPLAYYSSRES
ncbi:prepilin-type N-terminal cleavage/methylation domain-containing protein [Christensenellaceae bacterium OttesenSCG-928-K19]|nr:prepilin-type N-terminal cleavage/methylation domain-containing protein [Christensenellaceae bacterium OttesenSCG-928-K19]